MTRTARINGLLRLAIILVPFAFASLQVVAGDDAANRGFDDASARKILEAAGVQGGLIVHVGCGDGKLTAALRAGRPLRSIAVCPPPRKPRSFATSQDPCARGDKTVARSTAPIAMFGTKKVSFRETKTKVEEKLSFTISPKYLYW